jgi:two-component system response regulator RpaA
MPTILVVDDRRDAQLSVSAKLEGMGFAVKTSESALDIVVQVVEALADIVFMDMNMPEIDGFEAAQILRKDERTEAIPIVMLSNTTSLEERNLAIQAGCVELIGKPLDQELVKELLSRLLNASSHSP